MKSLVALVMMAAFATIVVEHSHIHAVEHSASEHRTESCVFCNHTVVSGPAASGLPVLVRVVEPVVRVPVLQVVTRPRPAHLARGPPSSWTV